ncbi:MAG: extracellular solute-binding protein [Anaerolineales bacterium]
MKNMNRRAFLRATTLTSSAVLLAACQPKVVEVEKVVTQIVKEEVIVEGTPKVIEKVVEVQAPTAAAKESVTVRDIVWGMTAKMIPMYEMIAQSFHEKFPHITVEHIFLPEAQHTARIQTMLAAGDPPEVASPLGGAINYFRAPDFSEWLDLKPYIERENYDLSDFHEVSIFSATNPFTGALDGMPVQLFCGCLIYNKDLFEAAGIPEPPHEWNTDDWDLESMVEMALQLTVDNTGKTASQSGFDPENIVQYGFYTAEPQQGWGFSFGGHSPRTDIQDRRNVGLDDLFIEGSDYWRTNTYDRHFQPPPYEATEFSGLLSSPFHTGKVAMQSAMTWNVSSFRDIADFRFDFAALPHGPARDRFINRLCMDQAAIFAKAKFHDESWEWVKYISSEEISYRYSVDLRECLPARISQIPKYGERLAPTFSAEIDANMIAEGLAYSHYEEAWPPPTGWLNDIWTPYSEKVLYNTEPASTAYPECRELLQKNWDEYYAQFE